MCIFLLGAGYSARAFARQGRGRAEAIFGTTRLPQNFEALRRDGIEPLLFDDDAIGPEMAAALKETTHLVLSAAPEASQGRAVAYGRISPTPSRFAGHLSPTSVGERKGAKPRGQRFLSPVERGRGGPRSGTEWGSNSTGDRPVSAEGTSHDPFLPHIEGRFRYLMPALRWIGYLSTVGVYGDHGGVWVDEESECRPVSPRSVARLAAEGAWKAFGEREALPVAVLRLAGIYGPGRNALVNLEAGRARRIVKPGQVFNRIHVDDIAGALSLLAEKETGGVFNLADGEPCPPQDVVAFAARLKGVEPPPEQPFETAEMTPMARSFYGENKRVSNGKLKAAGYRLAFPEYRTALSAMWRSGDWR